MIVNADSAQVYRDLPILSAAPRPGRARAGRARLYGVLDGALPCSAADWAAMARAGDRGHPRVRPAADPGRRHGPLPAHLARRDRAGPGDRSRRSAARSAKRRSRKTAERLAELDPDAAARLKPADTTRIARALEVVLSTGRTLAEWQQERDGGIAEAIDLRPLILLPPRDWLYAAATSASRA